MKHNWIYMTVLVILIAVLLSGCSAGDNSNSQANTNSITNESIANLSTSELIVLRDLINQKLDTNDSLLGLPAWYDYGLGKLLPDPDSVAGKKITGDYQLRSNSDSTFTDKLFDVSSEDFEKYIASCRSVGFNNNLNISGTSFEGDNGKWSLHMIHFRDYESGKGDLSIDIYPIKD